MKKINFCKDWRFGEAGDGMQSVLLPHDATQQQGRAADAPSGSGGAYYLGGCYEYVKTFTVPADVQYTSLLFEGVYPQARVLLNGVEVGGCAYGYSQFEVPLTGLHAGEENTVTVIVENTGTPNSRWYAGAGIYRPVWLLLGNASRIPCDGLRVTTLSCAPAVIRVETQQTGAGEVSVDILDGEQVVATASGNDVTITIPDARLWSAEHPNLYTCRVVLMQDGEICDTAETTFGIRQVTWSTDGLFVNGEKVLLRGGCVHADNGILGARTFDESEWRRIRKLKEWGFNAIRSAHNPLCRAALEACDALGMYVMDETWDMWNKHKNPHDYAGLFDANWRGDVRAMIAKDYNHPSVIMYSVGNEVTEPAAPEGMALMADIVREVRQQDETRPVTAGLNITLLLMASMDIPIFASDKADNEAEQPASDVNSTAFNEMAAASAQRMVQAAASEAADRISAPAFDLLDIAGYNYAQSRYEHENELHPGRIVVGSETYPQDLPGNWQLVKKCPWVIGDFMWTVWDYLGEVGLGAWCLEEKDMVFAKPYPWKLADSGALDILGNDNAEAGMAAVVWGVRKTPYIGVRPMNNHGKPWARATWRGSNAIPSWSWKGCEGQVTEVEVYTRGHEAELYLNGECLGRKMVEDCKAVFTVPYQPGELKAVAIHDDGTWTESLLRSTEGQTRIAITPEEEPQLGRLLYVDISLRGENGEVESHADEGLTVSVQGGKLLAYGSALPKTTDEFTTGTYTTYYGRSQAVIIVTGTAVQISVEGESLPAVQTVLAARAEGAADY